MFVSVACDLSGEDTRKEVAHILLQYHFKPVLANVFESARIGEKSLLRLKRDLDKATDFYDIIRFYQYPVENTLVITELKKNKWARTLLKS
ncbi:MAG: CRISPR-associated protein Cas2 [Spirochaetales bacterium]|nr:CRISPR-associated protein Cas2 [Spirochaetales bacterium]MCF7937142.1 CRISPR-associated protein Cas2 [Spirochaetales bacterium]